MIKLNDLLITPTMFPDKTSQVWKLTSPCVKTLERSSDCTIFWVFENEAEFLHVAQLKTLIDHYGPVCNLDMPYLPYGRQDKPVSNDNTFALHTFSKLINSLNFNSVRVIDAHNNARANMINNLEDIGPKAMIAFALEATDSDTILYPDEGADIRYYAYNTGYRKICAIKDRSHLTGEILGIRLLSDPKNRRILIVDDICDGGATFVGVATEALSRGAKEVHLYVTHGIFSKGLAPLRAAGIKRIFTYKGEVNG